MSWYNSFNDLNRSYSKLGGGDRGEANRNILGLAALAYGGWGLMNENSTISDWFTGGKAYETALKDLTNSQNDMIGFAKSSPTEPEYDTLEQAATKATKVLATQKELVDSTAPFWKKDGAWLGNKERMGIIPTALTGYSAYNQIVGGRRMLDEMRTDSRLRNEQWWAQYNQNQRIHQDNLKQQEVENERVNKPFI
jgi:hypothetical protein